MPTLLKSHSHSRCVLTWRKTQQYIKRENTAFKCWRFFTVSHCELTFSRGQEKLWNETENIVDVLIYFSTYIILKFFPHPRKNSVLHYVTIRKHWCLNTILYASYIPLHVSSSENTSLQDDMEFIDYTNAQITFIFSMILLFLPSFYFKVFPRPRENSILYCVTVVKRWYLDAVLHASYVPLRFSSSESASSQDNMEFDQSGRYKTFK